MFEFTREFIINNNVEPKNKKGALKGVRFAYDETCETLMVSRMCNIRKADVISIHKNTGFAAINELVQIKLADLPGMPEEATEIANRIARLVITIEQEGRVTALVNDQYPWHSKEYFYEGCIDAEGKLDKAAEKWVMEANREAAMESEDRLIEVRFDEGMLEIEALDCYTRVKEVRICVLPAITELGHLLTGHKDYKVLGLWNKRFEAEDYEVEGVEMKAKKFAAGNEGAGTVARILKNMRLLSDANIDPYGLQRDERPIPGEIYDQYTVECVSERRQIGHQVFGAIDKSLTTYVFFVAQGVACDENAASALFEKALEKLCDVCTVYDAPAAEGEMPEVKVKHVGGKAPIVALNEVPVDTEEFEEDSEHTAEHEAADLNA